MRLLAALFALISVLLLSGCPAAIVGAGALTYGVAEDRRTSGTMIDDDNIETRVSRGVRERFGVTRLTELVKFQRKSRRDRRNARSESPDAGAVVSRGHVAPRDRGDA